MFQSYVPLKSRAFLTCQQDISILFEVGLETWLAD